MDYNTIQKNMLALATSTPDYPVYSDEELDMWAKWYHDHPLFSLHGISFIRFMWCPVAHCMAEYTGLPWSEPDTVFTDGGHRKLLPAQRFAAASADAPRVQGGLSVFFRPQAD